MSLEYFGHPFSSYTQKVLIALWADGTDFNYRMIEDPENMEELRRHSPFGFFPLLIDDSRPVFESSTIIEHLHAHHRGANDWIPEGETGRRVRFLDRFFDLYVMGNMQRPVADTIRPEGANRDPFGVEKAPSQSLRLAGGKPRRRTLGRGRALHDGRLRRRSQPLLRRLGRGNRTGPAKACRISRPSPRASDRCKGCRRGTAVSALFSARRARSRLVA